MYVQIEIASSWIANYSKAFMSDQDDLPPEYANVPRDMLKHGKGRYSSVILIPQPSDSPNDPLNVSPHPNSVVSRILICFEQWPQW